MQLTNAVFPRNPVSRVDKSNLLLPMYKKWALCGKIIIAAKVICMYIASASINIPTSQICQTLTGDYINQHHINGIITGETTDHGHNETINPWPWCSVSNIIIDDYDIYNFGYDYNYDYDYDYNHDHDYGDNDYDELFPNCTYNEKINGSMIECLWECSTV